MIRYTHYADDRLIVTVLQGELSRDELLSYVLDLSSVDAPEGRMRGLTVFRKSTQAADINFNTMFQCGQLMKQANFRKQGRNAIVTENSLGYGLARMYQSVCEVAGLDEIRVYKEVEFPDALRWLDIDHLMAKVHEALGQAA